MVWRVIPKELMPILLRLYAVTVGGAVAFAAGVMVIGAPRSRESLAVYSATICLAIGLLLIGQVYAQLLTAAGARNWVAHVLLVGLVLSPGAFAFFMPRWGPLLLALAVLLFLFSARKGSGGQDAR
jgi:hypothetical protein